MASDVVCPFSSLWFPVFFIHRETSFEVLSILPFFCNGAPGLSFPAGSASCRPGLTFLLCCSHTLSCNSFSAWWVFSQQGFPFSPPVSLSIANPACQSARSSRPKVVWGPSIVKRLRQHCHLGRYGPSVARRGWQSQHQLGTHQNCSFLGPTRSHRIT